MNLQAPNWPTEHYRVFSGWASLYYCYVSTVNSAQFEGAHMWVITMMASSSSHHQFVERYLLKANCIILLGVGLFFCSLEVKDVAEQLIKGLQGRYVELATDTVNFGFKLVRACLASPCGNIALLV